MTFVYYRYTNAKISRYPCYLINGVIRGVFETFWGRMKKSQQLIASGQLLYISGINTYRTKYKIKSKSDICCFHRCSFAHEICILPKIPKIIHERAVRITFAAHFHVFLLGNGDHMGGVCGIGPVSSWVCDFERQIPPHLSSSSKNYNQLAIFRESKKMLHQFCERT